MTEDQKAAERVAFGLTDEVIESLALQHIAPHFGKWGVRQNSKYSETEQFRRIKALIEHVLSLVPRQGRAALAQREPVADVEGASRSKFEIAWMGHFGENANFCRNLNGDYLDNATQIAWEGYQLSHTGHDSINNSPKELADNLAVLHQHGLMAAADLLERAASVRLAAVADFEEARMQNEGMMRELYRILELEPDEVRFKWVMLEIADLKAQLAAERERSAKLVDSVQKVVREGWNNTPLCHLNALQDALIVYQASKEHDNAGT